MRVAIVAPSPVPFSPGGAERVWSGLLQAINEGTPHDAELIKLPVRERTLAALVEGYAAFARLDLSHFDMVVSGKYPAWMVAHPHHVVYVLHRLRGLYDTYHLTGAPERVDLRDPDLRALQLLMRRRGGRAAAQELMAGVGAAAQRRGADDPALALPGPFAREVVHFLDGVAFASMRRHLAISRTVAARRDYFPAGAAVEVAYPPSDLGGARCGGFDFLFSASRVEEPKRMHLLVEAMRSVPQPVELRIAGTGPDLDRCRRLAAGDPRIRFLGQVTRQQLRDLYADALAVPFVPRDEDLGLITLEAMACGKPVVTTTDSGGPTELVVDGITGCVVPAEPAALGAALASLCADPAAARRMGAAGRLRARAVSWDAVVARLLPATTPPAAASPSRRRARPRIVALSTFAVHPRRGGGQIRSHHLLGALAERYDVELLSLVSHGGATRRVELAPGLVETVIPKSAEHEAREQEIAAEVRLPVTDVVAATLIGRTPEYLQRLRDAGDGAEAGVLVHPYLHPALAEALPGLRTVYDAQDVAVLLKAAVLPQSETGLRLLAETREVEAAVVRSAALVAACSADDARALREQHGGEPGRFAVVPNGVDAGATAFVGGERRRRRRHRWLERAARATGGTPPRHSALFMGSWHPPNIDAAHRVVAAAERLPEVAFLMVGSHCTALEGEALPDNVVLCGELPDALKRSLLWSADLGLNPMVRGSGTNLKLVEYFAAGLPVVSTPLGARGVEVRAGEHLWIAPAEELAPAVGRALRRSEEGAAMAARARRLVEEELDWAVIGARFRDAVSAALRS
jgi:glycosyltransferase involved in cell wall biosynthesis